MCGEEHTGGGKRAGPHLLHRRGLGVLGEGQVLEQGVAHRLLGEFEKWLGAALGRVDGNVVVLVEVDSLRLRHLSVEQLLL